MIRFLLSIFAFLMIPGLVYGQMVPIKTIPVSEGDQFWLFPANRAGMGGVGIALDDRLADPYVNPAKGAALGGVQFISTPVYYGFGPLNGRDGEGSGRTLPVGVLMNQSGAFGGVMLAYQELVSPRAQPCCFGRFDDIVAPREESSISTSNLYLFGMGGMQIPNSDWAVGVSAFHGKLAGLEGVQLLYSADAVRQNGSLQQFRAGAFREWGAGHSAELILLHHRFEMTHRMQVFNAQGADFREEHDETRSFGAQAGYRHAFSTGWTLGARLVGDWKWHPKIPNYDLMQIPRDPGHSAAYNIGVGVATTSGAATFGFDLIFEPIWSRTWANAVEATETANGGVIHPGGKTVENDFVFNNALIRMGMQHQGDRIDIAVGIDMHRIAYDLDQMDYVESQRRLLDQHWTEWTVSGGLGTTFSGMRLQYTGRLTLGTGTPSVRRPWNGRDVGFADAAAGEWVVAPRGPLFLDETKVLSHQLSLIVPLAH